MTVQLELVQVNNNNNNTKQKYGKHANNGGYAWCGKCGERKEWDMKRCDECNSALRHRRRNKVRVECACGCGTTVDKYRKTDPYHQNPRRYILGHYAKTDSHKLKVSQALKGNHIRKGTKTSDEGRRNMSIAQQGKRKSEETRSKMRLSRLAYIIRKTTTSF